MNAYSQLEKQFSRLNSLDHASAILGWDEAVMMPSGSGEARAQALAELKVLKHETLVSPVLYELLQKAESQTKDLNAWQQANLREIKQIVLNARAVEKDLVEAISLAQSRCEQAWRHLRQENNWHDFLPLLETVVSLSREEASQRAQALQLPDYDCLIAQFSPGITSQEITAIFDQVKSFLPSLIQKIEDHQHSLNPLFPSPAIPIEHQKHLGLEIMEVLGFDFNKGRLDLSHHPFCGGVPQDVRITTRYNTHHFIESLTGVIHETGHARYEQNLPTQWAQQPVGMARGMDIHESQSLFFENYIGRNQNFLTYLHPLMMKHLASHATDPFWSFQNIYYFFNQVKKSYIRVNADEVTYPAHIILRYEIERDLITQKIDTKDIPELWDEKMNFYLGLSTKGNFKNGCMQDVHWPSGAFGYFPSYSLGSMIAAQLFSSMKKALPSLEDDLKRGHLQSIQEWLQKNIWAYGSFYSSSHLLLQATGEKLNPLYFKNYIEEKYLNSSSAPN